MNILINCRPSGRIASALHDKLENDGIKHDFIQDVFISDFSALNGKTHLIAMAWNTKPGYKDDVESNIKYASANRMWINESKQRGIHTTYLGTSDTSGFEDCPYHAIKNSLDGLADVTLKIPYVWQPLRVGSIAYLVENNLPYKIFDSEKLISYVTENQIVNEIMQTIDDFGIFDMAKEKDMIVNWIEHLRKEK